MRPLIPPVLAVIGGLSLTALAAQKQDPAAVRACADQWRTEHRLIDMHQHLDFTPEHLARAVKIMDAVGIGAAVNLGTGIVTRGADGGLSEFERNKKLADTLYPGRILHYMLVDYKGWDDPDWSRRAVKQVEEGHRLGAAGLKEFKRLGLYLRDGKGKLLRVDDPKLDPVWERCGELNMPISIHVADPKAFWEPYNGQNERWKELKGHRLWWFGDTKIYPAWKDLLEALNRVIARHPKTTFVCVHFANCPEDLDWVDQSLDRYPNMMVDLAARVPELGRHDPETVRKLFIKYQDRILLGSDFQVYDRLILGSSGPDEPPPSDRDAEAFFCCVWCATPSRRLWQMLCFAGAAGFATAIGVHPVIGYLSIMHLAPAVFVAVGLFWTLAVARFALLAGEVGIGLALLGIIVAATRRGRGMVLPVAGALVSCAAIAFIVLATRGLLPDRFVPPGQHAGSIGAMAKVETDSPDSPAKDPAGAISPIAPARAGDVEVRLASALVLRPSVYDGDSNTVHTATARYLQITLELRNLGESGEVAYQTWGKPASEGPFASVTDARENPLKLMDLSPMIPVGRAKEPKTLYARGPAVPDVLLFEPPVSNNADLTLELPGANVGMPGKTLSLRIPAEVIKRQ